MSRWQPDARERLEQAALELFVAKGFAQTTVPQITARAGLTTRTFFRHFADKREVLFAHEGDVPALAARLIAQAPRSLSPMRVIVEGLDVVAAQRFAGSVDHFRTRRSVIESDESLRERELGKLACLSDAIRRGFVDRGVDELTAALTAQVTVTVFSTAVSRWLDQDGDATLTVLLHDTLAHLRSVMADPSWDPAALTRTDGARTDGARGA